MRILLLATLLLAGLVGLPAADAQEATATPVEGFSSACVAAAAAPPCGYIMPYMDTTFEGKERCGTAFGGSADGCPLLMEKGESREWTGTLVWHWDITQDGTYPPDPNTPIEITFAGTATNPTWMDFTIEPESFVIDAAEFANSDNYRVDQQNPADPRLEFWYERAITVTITRNGDPGQDDLDRIFNKGGLVQFAVKGRSTESGQYYKRAFTLEDFRFDGRALLTQETSDDKDTPSISPAASLAVLAAAAFALRRRD